MRYKAVEGSVLGHGCCFDATVIDTQSEDDVVCECHGFETAQKIADALNKAEQQ